MQKNILTTILVPRSFCYFFSTFALFSLNAEIIQEYG